MGWLWLVIGMLIGRLWRWRIGVGRARDAKSESVARGIAASPLIGKTVAEAEQFIDFHEERRKRLQLARSADALRKGFPWKFGGQK